jgi:hypothetical protein
MCSVVVCAAAVVAALILLLPLSGHRFEGKTSHSRAAAVFTRGASGGAGDRTEPVVRARAVEFYGKLPLSFEANRGQTDRQVKFLSRGSGYSLFLAGNEAVLSLRKRSAVSHQLSAFSRLRPSGLVAQHSLSEVAALPKDLLPTTEQLKESFAPRDEAQIPNAESQTPAVLRMKLVGANERAKVTGLEKLPGKSNYFIGNDPKKWRTNVPNYAKVKYANVYPGIDLVYYGNQGQLEYDFVVQPGADPRQIALDVGAGLVPAQGHPQELALNAVKGVPLQLDGNGDLVVGTDDGEVIFHKPVVCQPEDNRQSSVVNRPWSSTKDKGQGTKDGGKHYVDGRYVLTSDQSVAFQVASYDPAKPLVIDPVLAYSTYLGGSHNDIGYGIAVGASGDAYVTGQTASSDFPTTPGAFQTTFGGGSLGDAFVSKINATGSALVYSTYLGGISVDYGISITVDSSGAAYVTGGTRSTEFPTTPGAFQTTYGGNLDAFVSKLNADGSALLYSIYLGGSNIDQAYGIAADASGNAYVTGFTESSHFPTTPGAFQPTSPKQCSPTGLCSPNNAFVSRLNATGSALLYSTYLGGVGNDYGFGIAVDGSGNAYVTGITSSSNFPTTLGAFQTACPVRCLNNHAFVTKLNASGSALVYSTYLGGSGGDAGNGIAVDASANAHLTGSTSSSDFPTTPGAFQTTYGGDGNAFITKLNASGSALVYSTYLGGSGGVAGSGIAVDPSGNAYLTGGANADFPTTPGAFQTT